MPDAPATTAPAAQVAPQPPPPDASPNDVPAVGPSGAPLTAGSSLDDLLRADPIPVGGAKAPIEVPAESGRSVAGIKNEPQGEAPPTEAPPIEAQPAAAPEAVEEPPVEEPAAETEPEPPKFDEEREIQRLIQQKTDLLRTQGRKNQELGDLRRQVAEMQQQLQQVQMAPQQAPPAAPVSPEDLAARLLENPAAVITGLVSPLVEQQARAIAQQVIAQQSEAWQQEQEFTAAAVAPEVGKDLFLARHGISQDFNSWCNTDEGKAVNALFERDASRSRLLEAYRDDANPKGIADVLTQALQAHRIGKKAAQGRHAQSAEQARIAAAHPPSAPVRPATPLPSSIMPPQEKSIFDPSMTEAELANWMKNAEKWERDA